jgi:L-ascorbate metabolism protein UlaG (beta-lactamase superfamily)
MQLTWLDSNSWLWEIGGQRILVDPWLVGSLVFGGQDWFFKGEKPERAIPDAIDLILISQGLPDHAHLPTLKVLDRNTPAIASPNAAKVLAALDYRQITTLAPRESMTFADSVKVEALPGSAIGPQLIENAYIVEELTTGHRLYYEPHGYHDGSLGSDADIDVIITPIVGLSLLNFIPVLKGQQTTLTLCQKLKPQTVISTAGAGEINYGGMLASLIREDGTIAEFERDLLRLGLNTQAIAPRPWEPIALNLQPKGAGIV